MRLWFHRVLGALLIALALVIAWQATLTPNAEREWAAELSKTAVAGENAGLIYLNNVRDWTYAEGRVLEETWIDETAGIDPRSVARAWFVFEPFSSMPLAGHTYLTFELDDGRAYSFSVEARKEADEDYSAFKGLFRQYELAYTWGTERDFLTRRLLYLGHSVRMYPLSLDRDAAGALFAGLVRDTNALAESPRFYHTFAANCTNLLAEMANSHALPENELPYDLAWNLPGLSEGYLRRVGLIGEGDYDLSLHRADIAERATLAHAAFGAYLRAVLPAD